MNESVQACPVCGRMKAVDGYRFCGGSYCLKEAGPDYDPNDGRLNESWAAEGNPNEPGGER